MPSFDFSVGKMLDFDGSLMRIDRLQQDEQVLLQRADTGQLDLYTRQQLLVAYTQGRIRAIEPSGLHAAQAGKAPWGRPLADLPETVQAELCRRKHYIEWVQGAGHYTYCADSLRPILAAAAAALNDPNVPSPTTAYRWLSRYKASGNDIRALIPRWDRRGSHALKQPTRLLELLEETFAEAYRLTPAATMKTIETRLAIKLTRENAFRLASDQLVMPSRRTLYRMLGRLEVYERTVMKQGKAVAQRQLRIVKNVEPVRDILERVEMDHTPLDLFLIDERTWLPLGRPTLTVALDGFSRMLLGYYLSFGGASAAAVLGALRHAILPKLPATPYLQGVHINHPWPCYDRMDCLVLDNGLEFHGKDLDSVALDLGIYLQFCPTRVPQFKGRVERMLKTINYSFAHQIPGTSLARFTQRGDYDPQKHALLTLGEFKHAFEKWLLDDYAQTIHKGIGTTPWAKWQEGFQRRQPELPSSPAVLQRRIGKVEERSLRHDGLWLHGIRYSSDALNVVLHAFGRGVRVRLVYDPEDLGTIEVWTPGQNDPVSVPAVHQGYACGLTLFQHERLQENLRESGRKAEDPAALSLARQQLAESLEALMHSRKQQKRRESARLHGKTSTHPSRQFGASSPENLALSPAPAASKLWPSRDIQPTGKYPLVQVTPGSSGEEP